MMGAALFLAGLLVGLAIEQAVQRRHRQRGGAAPSLQFRIGPVSDVRPSRPSPKE